MRVKNISLLDERASKLTEEERIDAFFVSHYDGEENVVTLNKENIYIYRID